ncbi:MAG: DUF1573 domain-containing protein [Patescibacteria group bacterium]
MNDKKIIFLMIASATILLFGGVFFLTKTTTPEIKASQNAKAYVSDPTSFDWGTIPMSKGNVVKSFTIKNTGADTLKLYNVKTSCHCTKAYITIDGADSPSFGMEGLSSWTGEVPKGTEAKLTAVFDPAFHGPAGTGPVNRFVSVETNDPANTKLTFTLTGNVVK